MKRSVFALSAIIALGGAGLFLLSLKSGDPIVVDDAATSGSVLAQALSDDAYATCAFADEGNATSTAYVHRGKIRLDVDGENNPSTHLIILGDAEYVWTDESEKGIIRLVDAGLESSGSSTTAYSTTTQSNSAEFEHTQQTILSRDELIRRLRGIDCSSAEISKKLFQIPANIDFRTAERKPSAEENLEPMASSTASTTTN